MTRRFFAPGRVNLIGDHTDYSGGLALPLAIPQGLTLEVTAHERVRIRSDQAEAEVDLAADGSSAVQQDGWSRYVSAVIAELGELGRPPIGIAGTLRSTLPLGAGVSSSAALAVVVASALIAVANMDVDEAQLVALCRRAEMRAVGVPCGSLDQSACVFGLAGHLVELDFSSRAHGHIQFPVEAALVLIDSGTTRQLEHSAYGRRRTELEDAIVRACLSSGDLRSADAWSRIERVGLDAVGARRLRHVIGENIRVSDAARLLRRAPTDLDALGRLLDESHASLRDCYEVSTRALDELVESCLTQGALGARLTGGGFGGAIVALTTKDFAAHLAAEVLGRYQRRHPDLQATALICEPADGARELSGASA